MSIKLMSAAINTNLNIEMKFVLMLLADNSDYEGRGSVRLESLSRQCSLNLERTYDVVDALIVEKIIELGEFNPEHQEPADFCDFQINLSHLIFNNPDLVVRL